jgi:hypothetical protein
MTAAEHLILYPRDLEATRFTKPSGNALISIIGTKKADGWRAAVEIRGPLNAEQLRMLADEARRFADLFDERVDW